MRLFMSSWLGCLVALLIPDRATAQFYAPETEYHDKAQRLFPVEAARLLAWRENAREPGIHEVTYQVSVDTNRVTSWKIAWRDKSGAPLKEFSVSYPESLLTEGPRFYREVFGQLSAQAGFSPSSPLAAKDLSDRFWAGAELNGMAREDGLRAALNLVATNSLPEEARLAPTLAGLLVHDTLPSLCGGLTLDSTLLARGAAWLALSESMVKPPEAVADENWAPVLFLAGRERGACKLWTAQVKTGAKPASGPVLFAWWDCFLRRPSAREAFVFVARTKQRKFGMPMMTYYSRVEDLGSPLVQVLYDLYQKDWEKLPGLHNYGWFMACATEIAGGRMLEGAWAAIAREEWRSVFERFVPSPVDYTGYMAKLKAVPPQDPLNHPDAEDASLTGLDAFAPLLQLGYEEGAGKLVPAGVLTARDLLNYGWEMNGLQMGGRYFFARQRWGVPELAETLYKRATRNIEGQAPFFPSPEQGSVFNLQTTLYRLQLVDDVAWRVDVNIQPFAKDTSNPEAARLFHRRCWLCPYLVRWEAWSMAKASLSGDIIPLLRRYHEECGLKSDEITLEYFRDCWNTNDFEKVAGLRQLRTDIAKSMIDPTAIQFFALADEENSHLFPEQFGQRKEELFWRNPSCQLETAVVNSYISGGAWKSIKRFYRQSREVLPHDVSFSNCMAPKAWMLGFLTGDEDLMKLALEDSQTGSAAAMWTHIWHYAAHDRVEKMETQIDEMIERYESQKGPRSPGRMTKDFVRLMPALKDPQAPEHEAALDHFGKTETALGLRWILIQKYKLSPADAIRFLGGKETDRARHVMVLHLLNDKDHMREAIIDYQMSSENNLTAKVIANWAARQTLPEPVKIEEKDLRPAGAQSIQQAVRAALR